MAELRLFQICLFLILSFTAVTQQYTRLSVEVGGDVTLLCENGKYFHGRCSSTTWLFSASGRSATVTLFEDGQIHKDAGSQRLNVTANCSLVIQRVTSEDDGRYTCRQYRSGDQVTDSGLDLSVINTVGTSPSRSSITVRVGDTATLPCENGKDFQNKYQITTWLFSASGRNATVTLFEHGQIHKDAGSKSYRLSVTADCSLVIQTVTAEDDGPYTCRQYGPGQEVTDSHIDLSVINRKDTRKATVPATTTSSTADVINSTSAKSTTTTTISITTQTASSSVTMKSSMTSKTKSTTERENSTSTDFAVQNKTTLIILAVGFAVLFIIMAVIGWRRTKRNKTQRSDEIELNMDYCTIPETSQDRAKPAAGVSYASIKKANNKTQVHSKYHKGDAWTSARAFSDDNSIYVNLKHI